MGPSDWADCDSTEDIPPAGRVPFIAVVPSLMEDMRKDKENGGVNAHRNEMSVEDERPSGLVRGR